ncbi:uncharacterized protein LOC111888318 [Lactuca sativa]|nr:uncharacterized protein LOC111888318 [Lactuca sativa]
MNQALFGARSFMVYTILKENHGSISRKITLSGVWKNISKVVNDLAGMNINVDDIFQQHVFLENKTLLWKDKWIAHNTLNELFPNLYALESRKTYFISERREGKEHDKFRRKLNPDGEYTVNALQRLVDSKNTNIGGEPFIWLQIVPKKVSNFVWRVKQGKILVAAELSKRGVQTDSRICKLCNTGEESTDHLLTSCTFASEVIKRTLNWCEIRQVQFTKVKELLDFGARWGNCPKKCKRLLAILYGLIWRIWKARNNIIFNNMVQSPTSLVDDVIALVFSWHKFRGSCYLCKWFEWCCSPFLCCNL